MAPRNVGTPDLFEPFMDECERGIDPKPPNIGMASLGRDGQILRETGERANEHPAYSYRILRLWMMQNEFYC